MSFKQILKKGASVLVAFAFSIMPHAVSVSGVDSDLTTVIGDNFSATSYHNEEAFRVREIRDVSSGNRNDFGHVYFGGNECYVGRANTSSKRVTLFSKNPYSFTPFVVGTGPTTVSQGSYAESYVRRYLNPENVTGTIPTSGYVEATAGAFGPSSPAVTPNVESILKLADNRPAKNIRDDHFSDKLPEYEAILPAQGGLPVGDKFRLLTGSTTAAADLMDPVSGILINKMFIPTNSVTSKKIVNIRNGFANQSTGYALDTQTPDKEAVTLKMLLPLFDLDLSKVKYVSLRNGATVTTKFQNVSNINYGNTKSAELLLTIDDTSGSELGEYKGVDVNRSGKNITFKVTNLDNESVPLNTNEYISVIFDDGQSTELVKANVVGGMFNATSTLTGDELNAKILICKDNKNGNYSSSSVQDMTMQVSDYKITYSRELIKDLTGGGGGTTVNNPGNNKSNNKINFVDESGVRVSIDQSSLTDDLKTLLSEATLKVETSGNYDANFPKESTRLISYFKITISDKNGNPIGDRFQSLGEIIEISFPIDVSKSDYLRNNKTYKIYYIKPEGNESSLIYQRGKMESISDKLHITIKRDQFSEFLLAEDPSAEYRHFTHEPTGISIRIEKELLDTFEALIKAKNPNYSGLSFQVDALSPSDAKFSNLSKGLAEGTDIRNMFFLYFVDTEGNMLDFDEYLNGKIYFPSENSDNIYGLDTTTNDVKVYESIDEQIDGRNYKIIYGPLTIYAMVKEAYGNNEINNNVENSTNELTGKGNPATGRSAYDGVLIYTTLISGLSTLLFFRIKRKSKKY